MPPGIRDDMFSVNDSDTEDDLENRFDNGEDLISPKRIYLECDDCGKGLQNTETMWGFDMKSPIENNDFAFCLCEACHSKETAMDDTWFNIDPSTYRVVKDDIGHCSATHRESVGMNESECRCRCIVCDRLGWSNDSGEGCEEKWFLGFTDIFGVRFWVLVCPDCIPADIAIPKTKDGIPSRYPFKADGQFTKKWFQGHLKKYTVGSIAVHADHGRFVLPQLSETVLP